VTVVSQVVKMKGENAFAIIAYVARELKNRGMRTEAIAYTDEAMSGDNANLIQASKRYAQMCDNVDDNNHANGIEDDDYDYDADYADDSDEDDDEDDDMEDDDEDEWGQF